MSTHAPQRSPRPHVPRPHVPHRHAPDTPVDPADRSGENALHPRRVRVPRGRPDEPGSGWAEYTVSADAYTTVLDALRDIRSHQDPTLLVRWSCCHGSCGTCGVRVNGAEVLGCLTRLDDVPGDTVLVEPMGNAPLVADLLTDPGRLAERFMQTGRPLVRACDTTTAEEPRTRLEDCIECGLCVSACPVAATDVLYPGPAALGAAWRVVTEPRGCDPAVVTAAVDDEQGVWRCHLAFECSAVCPTDADPAGAIMALRRASVRRALSRHGSGVGGGAR